MRILEGWTDEERKELEEAKDSGFLSVIALICSIKRDDDNCHALYEKYYRDDTNGNNQMAKDILDFYTGKAKFADPKKYYVHFIKSDEYSYLNINSEGGAELGTKFGFGHWKTKFTHEEIIAINPQFLLFEEEVEGDE